MKCLESDELRNIQGGLASIYKYGIALLLGGITFAASVIYGFIYPEDC